MKSEARADETLHLPSGFPRVTDYEKLLGSPGFRKLEAFSNEFVVSNRPVLRGVAGRWVSDALHQWSRQWEYPFVFERLVSIALRNPSAKIMDAGAGVTFFPFFAASAYPSANFQCVDSDGGLAVVYKRLPAVKNVAFSRASLYCLPRDNQSLDVIYCISVLEHVRDHRGVVSEFARVIRPGGRLLVTFDVSLDGSRAVSPEQGENLLNLLASDFELDPEACDLVLGLSQPDLLTTLIARTMDPSLLPWRLPSVAHQGLLLLRGRGLRPWPPALTVYCLDLIRRAEAVQR